MELGEPRSTITLLSRIVYQLPTIVLSTITMVAISRNLGPSGRGEVSQFLLLSGLTSSAICTPVFLRVMNMKNSNEIKNYVHRTIYIFSQNNILLLTLMNIFFIIFNQTKSLNSNLTTLLLLNLLTLFYLISAQIRDLLLRFHKNKIYGIDFFLQSLISVVTFLFLISGQLTTSISLQIFTFSYGVYAIVVILVLKGKDHSFKASFVVRKMNSSSSHHTYPGKGDLYSKTGILFQFALSKDLLLGLFVLSKQDFGLMSAIASFWVVIRFLRPTAVIQTKMNERHSRDLVSSSWKVNLFDKSKISVILIQAISIVILGLSGNLLIPKLLGSGFQPSISMAIAGIGAEVLLMKTLYDLSTSKSGLGQNLFVLTFFFQILVLGVALLLGVKLSITLIWTSSALSYLMWQALSHYKGNHERN